MGLEDYGSFIEEATNDYAVVAEAVQTAFLHAAEAAGIQPVVQLIDK